MNKKPTLEVFYSTILILISKLQEIKESKKAINHRLVRHLLSEDYWALKIRVQELVLVLPHQTIRSLKKVKVIIFRSDLAITKKNHKDKLYFLPLSPPKISQSLNKNLEASNHKLLQAHKQVVVCFKVLEIKTNKRKIQQFHHN